jgi:hypothetical protein
MKRFFEFVTYLFYRYYHKGSTKIVAYESALIAVSAIIFLNMFAILIFFKVDTSWMDKIEQNYGGFIKLVSGLILVLPQYFILLFTLNKESITKRRVNIEEIGKWNVFLVLYIVFSILLLVFSVKMK